MQEYINDIIKTGLANGVSLDQMMNDIEATHKAYLDSKIKSLEEAGKEVFEKLRS